MCFEKNIYLKKQLQENKLKKEILQLYRRECSVFSSGKPLKTLILIGQEK